MASIHCTGPSRGIAFELLSRLLRSDAFTLRALLMLLQFPVVVKAHRSKR